MTADLAESRVCSTNEERVVLALELIADRLSSLVALMTPADTSEEELDIAMPMEANTAGEDAWENEGGGLDSGSAEAFGIDHAASHQFEIEGYHYTKLADAIAEAKRARARSAA